jgi:ribosome-associated protein
VVALARHLMDSVREQGVPLLGVEGVDAGEWVLVDLGDVVVHIMQQQTREFYDLEKLWGDFAAPLSEQA